MGLRYRVVGFVTYADERGRRCPIPIGETVDVRPAADGGGIMKWQDGCGRTWSEALSDRLLAHYTMAQLERVAAQASVSRPSPSDPRIASDEARHRRRV